MKKQSEVNNRVSEGKKIVLKKVKRGYRGNGEEWQLGERVFIASRSFHFAGRWYIYERPNINSSQEIFKYTGDYRTVIKKFKEFLNTQKQTS